MRAVLRCNSRPLLSGTSADPIAQELRQPVAQSRSGSLARVFLRARSKDPNGLMPHRCLTAPYFFDLSALLLRPVDAIFLSSFSLIDEAIDFDAPLSLLLGVSPRLAERAAPAAFCCAADFAGIKILLGLDRMKRSIQPMASVKAFADSP